MNIECAHWNTFFKAVQPYILCSPFHSRQHPPYLIEATKLSPLKTRRPTCNCNSQLLRCLCLFPIVRFCIAFGNPDENSPGYAINVLQRSHGRGFTVYPGNCSMSHKTAVPALRLASRAAGTVVLFSLIKYMPIYPEPPSCLLLSVSAVYLFSTNV